MIAALQGMPNIILVYQAYWEKFSLNTENVIEQLFCHWKKGILTIIENGILSFSHEKGNHTIIGNRTNALSQTDKNDSHIGIYFYYYMLLIIIIHIIIGNRYWVRGHPKMSSYTWLYKQYTFSGSLLPPHNCTDQYFGVPKEGYHETEH